MPIDVPDFMPTPDQIAYFRSSPTAGERLDVRISAVCMDDLLTEFPSPDDGKHLAADARRNAFVTNAINFGLKALRVGVALVAISLTSACAGPPAAEFPEAAAGQFSCSIYCSQDETGSLTIDADLGACVPGAGCGSCLACANLLAYHAAADTCVDENTTATRVVPVVCQ